MGKQEPTLQELALNFYNSRSEKDFTTLYYRIKPGINKYLRDMIPSTEDREEVMATAFAKIWTKIHQYDPYWNFSTWAYRVSRNEALLFFRAKKRTYSYNAMEEMGINMEAKLDHSFQDCYDEEITTTDQLHDLVLDEISVLPNIYKDVLTLREVEKKKYEDIAVELGWKLNTVRTRIHKARKLIRNKIILKAPQLIKHYQETI